MYAFRVSWLVRRKETVCSLTGFTGTKVPQCAPVTWSETLKRMAIGLLPVELGAVQLKQYSRHVIGPKTGRT